ncbi:MAG: hypothetical protein ACAI25_04495 [Planctomycetota bacterium]
MRLHAPVVLVLLIAASVHADERLTTGFDPKQDGLPYTNVGSYSSPKGDCFGMSLVALLRFKARTRGETATRDAYDLSGRALAGAIQNRYLAEWDRALGTRMEAKYLPVDDPRSGEPILARLRAGEPAIVHLYRGGTAHAVLFFGFEGGNFLIYDPDHPGETMKWGFSKRGFSTWSLTYGLGSVKSLSVYEAKDLDEMPTLADVEALRADCDRLGTTCAAPFAQVDAGMGTISGRDGDVAYVITGTVSRAAERGPDGSEAERPSAVVILVNGQPVETVRLDKNGRFEARLAAASFTNGAMDVKLAVTGSSMKERLAGFAQIEPPRVPSRTEGVLGALGHE